MLYDADFYYTARLALESGGWPVRSKRTCLTQYSATVSDVALTRSDIDAASCRDRVGPTSFAKTRPQSRFVFAS